MPELPEIETTRRAVEPLVAGRTIESVDVRHPGVIAHPDATTFAERLTGRTILGMDRRGKYLVARLDDGSQVTMHMRMTGCLVAAPTGYPEDRHTHVVLHMEDGTEMRFSDMRRFGRFWHFGPDEEDDSGIGRLGPEPDDPSFDTEYLEGRIGGSHRAVKECLLDQTVVAGIGNIYSDEILFETGIDPARPADSLTHDEFGKLAHAIPELLGYFTETNLVTPEEHLSGRALSEMRGGDGPQRGRREGERPLSPVPETRGRVRTAPGTFQNLTDRHGDPDDPPTLAHVRPLLPRTPV